MPTTMKPSAPHRSLSFQGEGSFALHPQEVVLIDRHHKRSEDPWQVFREKGDRIAKVVPTRCFEVQRTPHRLLVQLQAGVRVYVFYHLIGKTPEDDDYSEKHYLDHIHHIAFQVALELGVSRRKLPALKSSIKKNKPRLTPENQLIVEDVRNVLRRILLVGTTNLALVRGQDQLEMSSQAARQYDLFDGEDDEPEDLDEICSKEWDADEEDADEDFCDLPLFSSRPRWGVKTVMWTPGSVANFLPASPPQSKETIISSVDRTLERFFRERLA